MKKPPKKFAANVLRGHGLRVTERPYEVYAQGPVLTCGRYSIATGILVVSTYSALSRYQIMVRSGFAVLEVEEVISEYLIRQLEILGFQKPAPPFDMTVSRDSLVIQSEQFLEAEQAELEGALAKLVSSQEERSLNTVKNNFSAMQRHHNWFDYIKNIERTDLERKLMRAVVFRDTGGFGFLDNEEIFDKYKRDFGSEPSQLGNFLTWWVSKASDLVTRLSRGES